MGAKKRGAVCPESALPASDIQAWFRGEAGVAIWRLDGEGSFQARL